MWAFPHTNAPVIQCAVSIKKHFLKWIILNNCLILSLCQIVTSGSNWVGRKNLWLCQVDMAASVLTSEHSWQQGPSSALSACPSVLVILAVHAIVPSKVKPGFSETFAYLQVWPLRPSARSFSCCQMLDAPAWTFFWCLVTWTRDTVSWKLSQEGIAEFPCLAGGLAPQHTQAN